MDTKICTNPDCKHKGQPQPLNLFGTLKASKDGLNSRCKVCQTLKMQTYYQQNKERLLQYQKEYRERTEEETQERYRQWREENKHITTKVCSQADCDLAGQPQPLSSFHKAAKNKDGLLGLCKKCNKRKVKKWNTDNRDYRLARSKQWRENNKELKKKRDTAYREQNREKIREYFRSEKHVKRRRERNKEYYHNNIHYKLKIRVSSSVRGFLRRGGKTKGGSTFDHLPYTPQDLKEHIEKQFDEHMTWENWGSYWHLDHIKPQAAFNYDCLAHPDFQKCWALENLRPLKATENLRKSSLYEGKRHYHNKD